MYQIWKRSVKQKMKVLLRRKSAFLKPPFPSECLLMPHDWAVRGKSMNILLAVVLVNESLIMTLQGERIARQPGDWLNESVSEWFFQWSSSQWIPMNEGINLLPDSYYALHAGYKKKNILIIFMSMNDCGDYCVKSVTTHVTTVHWSETDCFITTNNCCLIRLQTF